MIGPAILEKVVYSRQTLHDHRIIAVSLLPVLYSPISVFSQSSPAVLQVESHISTVAIGLITNQLIYDFLSENKTKQKQLYAPIEQSGNDLFIHFPSEEIHFSFGCLARI